MLSLNTDEPAKALLWML